MNLNEGREKKPCDYFFHEFYILLNEYIDKEIDILKSKKNYNSVNVSEQISFTDEDDDS